MNQKTSENTKEASSQTCEYFDDVFVSNWESKVKNFDDMGLNESLLRGIYGIGYKDPTPIQQESILALV